MMSKSLKLSIRITYIFFFISLFFLTFYSYSLVDPNFTLFNHPLWTNFRNLVINLGYYHRDWSSLIYFLLLLTLFIFYYLLLRNHQKIKPLNLALVISLILVFSYPFLSHDFFNYLFDAKILTFYGKNPYFYRALDFPNDQWLRFMHWTHRTYPYGPTFLLITIVPSFLSFNKFILAFFLFKLTWIIFYLLTVYLLNKLNSKWAIIFATNPLILIEGLINNHNDLIATSLGLIGIYLLFKNKEVISRLFFLLSGGIKYLTLPLVILSRKKNKNNLVVFFVIILLVIYLTVFSEIQPWYFLFIFAFIPFFEKLILRLNLFFFGLLASYYPYLRLGGWDTVEKIKIKHIIILIFSIINFIQLIYDQKNKKIFT